MTVRSSHYGLNSRWFLASVARKPLAIFDKEHMFQPPHSIVLFEYTLSNTICPEVLISNLEFFVFSVITAINMYLLCPRYSMAPKTRIHAAYGLHMIS